MSADIIEGFLCPICMKDLGTVSQLQGHFEEAHSSEDKAVFNQLKGFFDKAKKKILGDRVDDVISPNGERRGSDELGVVLSGYDPSWWEDQEFGAYRNHTDTFKGVRDARVDYFVVETNKLLIRLDKLLSPDAPIEPKKRKAFEREVVPWIPDSEVPACLTCGKSFSLFKRRHHCRLCGGIMCDKCSEIMASSYAQKLINPAHAFSGEGFLKRASSNTSLNSMLGSDGEAVMRVCKTCRKLLERRDKMAELRNSIPPIVQIYNKMKQCIQDAEEIIPEYMPMVESLSQGETAYTYREAQILRTKLVRLYEAVDQLSKRILVLDMGADNQSSANPRQILLQKSIRTYASNFMQENMIGLQALPSEEDYKKMRDMRAADIQRRIAAERREAMEAQDRERAERERGTRTSSNASQHEIRNLGHRRIASGGGEENSLRGKVLGGQRSGSVNSQGGASTKSDSDGGWQPSEDPHRATKTSQYGDPMLQQMEIIRSYIKQARQAQRHDEVLMLEQNLRDLAEEYRKQRLDANLAQNSG